MKIFLSYSTKDKKLAGEIKDGLEQYGQEVFLAHEDIEPSAKWVQRILSELDVYEVFIPLLTENFKASEWTDQEAGMAMAGNRIIIPVKIKDDPHGFISRYQALILSEDTQITCFEIMMTIYKQFKPRIKIKDILIRKFGKSRNYDETSRNFQFLASFDKFTNRQVAQILEHAMSNDQIFHHYSCRNWIRNFMKKNSKKIGLGLLKQCNEFFEIE